MNWLAELALLSAAVAGHVALCVWTSNRIHALGLAEWQVDLLVLPVRLALPAVPLAWLFWFARQLWDPGGGTRPLADLPPWALVHLGLCVLVACGPLPVWIVRRIRVRPPAVLKHNDTVFHDVAARLGSTAVHKPLGRLAAALPGNQILHLHVHEKTIEIPRLPPALDGLSIAHLSDLHYTGLIAKDFFLEVVDLANQMQADLVALTGDLMDSEHCFAWIPDTVGRLRARLGVYFVLGNHDTRVNTLRLRQMLVESGLVDLGGRWTWLADGPSRLLLAGNEMPWIRPGAELKSLPARSDDPHALRLLLAHTPDQFGWGRAHDFDLMLAGHTHGGQVQLPGFGPLVAPSRHGVKYASGTFHEPPTVMHVSRGISAKLPLRYYCPPELTRLILRAPRSEATPQQTRPEGNARH